MAGWESCKRVQLHNIYKSNAQLLKQHCMLPIALDSNLQSSRSLLCHLPPAGTWYRNSSVAHYLPYRSLRSQDNCLLAILYLKKYSIHARFASLLRPSSIHFHGGAIQMYFTYVLAYLLTRDIRSSDNLHQ